jgi:hypothetical protein
MTNDEESQNDWSFVIPSSLVIRHLSLDIAYLVVRPN